MSIDFSHSQVPYKGGLAHKYNGYAYSDHSAAQANVYAEGTGLMTAPITDEPTLYQEEVTDSDGQTRLEVRSDQGTIWGKLCAAWKKGSGAYTEVGSKVNEVVDGMSTGGEAAPKLKGEG